MAKKAYIVSHNKWGTVDHLIPTDQTTLQRLQEGRSFQQKIKEESLKLRDTP